MVHQSVLDMTRYLYSVSLEKLIQHSTSVMYRTLHVVCTKLHDIICHFYFMLYINVCPIISHYITKRILILSGTVQYELCHFIHTTCTFTPTSGKHIVLLITF
jgi:hypothetical protein